MTKKMSTRLLITLALALTLLTSCSSASASLAQRPRPVRRPSVAPPPVVQQWQNDWIKGAVFYQVFVRSFYDSNADGVGDLEGLIQKLDYLNDGNPATTSDLGVDALWLMPVFESPSYHGYDTVDYETIDREYGTNETFVRLCDEAHRRGIRIIVDYVINHSGSGHPWFQESASSEASPKRDWYVWRDDNPGWTQPWGGSNPTWHPLNGKYFYGVFWSGMPDLNYRSPAVREEFKRVARLWLSRGVDGYRLDATRHLVETGSGLGQSDTPETHAYLKEFAAAVRTAKPEAMLVGENWTDTTIIADYYGSTEVTKAGDELPMNFNFPLASAILQAIGNGDGTVVASKYAEMKLVYPAGVTDTPFLTNHDQIRLATQLGNHPGRLRNAPAVLLTLPGAPFLYYGEEIGLQNRTERNDEAKRTPMPWDATPTGGFTTGTPWFGFAPGTATSNVASQTTDPSSLLSRYREFIRVRHSSPALMRGEIEMLTSTSGQQPVLAYLRSEGAERVLVVHNLTDSLTTARLSFSAAGFDRLLVDQYVNEPSGSASSWSVTLPPRSSGVWRLR